VTKAENSLGLPYIRTVTFGFARLVNSRNWERPTARLTVGGNPQNEIKCVGLAVALDLEVSAIFADRSRDQ
jgi:hypothetical protein